MKLKGKKGYLSFETSGIGQNWRPSLCHDGTSSNRIPCEKSFSQPSGQRPKFPS